MDSFLVYLLSFDCELYLICSVLGPGLKFCFRRGCAFASAGLGTRYVNDMGLF